MRGPVLLLSMACLLGACDAPARNAAPGRRSAPEIEAGPEYDFPLGRRLFRLWRADAPFARETSSLRRGELEAGRPQDATVVLTGVRCYRAFAVTEHAVPGLTLTLVDPEGVPFVRSRADADAISLGGDEPICPPAPGTYRLRLEAGEATAYAMRMYGAMSM